MPSSKDAFLGTLIYGNSQEFELDDRTLAHVKFAIAAKLRRKETFWLTWSSQDRRGSGPTSIWISPDIPLGFRFSRSEPEPLSKPWLDALIARSYGSRGLVVFPERTAGGRRGA